MPSLRKGWRPRIAGPRSKRTGPGILSRKLPDGAVATEGSMVGGAGGGAGAASAAAGSSGVLSSDITMHVACRDTLWAMRGRVGTVSV